MTQVSNQDAAKAPAVVISSTRLRVWLGSRYLARICLHSGAITVGIARRSSCKVGIHWQLIGKRPCWVGRLSVSCSRHKCGLFRLRSSRPDACSKKAPFATSDFGGAESTFHRFGVSTAINTNSEDWQRRVRVRHEVQGYSKIPQIERVIIGDNVEIGANATVDRGALSEPSARAPRSTISCRLPTTS